ncbi:MAG: class I tRNA ligase family protein [bacterium]|nr:class I tRNA ligase family protein [bacterium]
MKNKAEQKQKSEVALREEAILKFWEENKIFQKSVNQRSGSKEFVFYEGPPTANGKPGIHHVLARSFKDIVCRYKTMRGYRVERKAGWDTHGLPVELQVEKELKISSKPEIEKYGIEEFNKKCKASVWEYKDEWERLTKRIAFWLDLEHPYITYSNEYIESVWWILSEIYKKGLLYEGHKVVPYCSRCGTGLSSHEVAQGYKKIPEKSVYVKFKVKSRLGTGIVVVNEKGEILLGKRIKTGQWTLPGGKVEKGETYEETIVRETKEETGIDIEIVKTLGLAESIIDGAHWRYQNFIGRAKGGELKDEKGKIEGWKWIAPDKLPENIYEPSGKTLKLFLADKKGIISDVLVHENDSTYFLVWTTTPWTLPGNVALAVGKDIDYVIIKYFGNKSSRSIIGSGNRKEGLTESTILAPGNYIIAKDILQKNLESNAGLIEIRYLFGNIDVFNENLRKHPAHQDLDGLLKAYNFDVIKGSELVGLEYKQLFDFVKPDPLSPSVGGFSEASKPAFRVVAGDFVTTQDGSGIVHIAPAFGEDDMRVAKENDLPVLMTVNLQGKFIPEITPWAGKYVAREETNKEIITELDKRKVLFKTEDIEHDYPFCWRCNTKLIYYAKKSWFIKMSDPKIKKALIENNEKINWIPEHIKKGRMGEWLREIKDWALSRERYWGTPLPIWKCAKCGDDKIIGSIAELEKFGGKKLEDLHRPFIDKVIFKCDKCGGEMKRITDVIDCWFDSGSMPFSQWHYPFENKELVDPSTGSGQAKGKKFPADYISEAIDQTRGWFYTLLAIATLLGKSAPYKNVITYGHILDAKGQKMSKSKGNVVSPWEVADKYGIDILRWYFYTVGGPGEPKRFDFKDLNEVQNKFYRTLWNSYQFFKTYAGKAKSQKPTAKNQNLLDKWIVSRLNETIFETTKLLDDYDIIRSARLIGDFTDDLSNWYIRRSRDRMRVEESAALWTLLAVLSELTKLAAPFVPFISEEIYRDIKTGGSPESIHLSDWPKADEKLIDKKLNEEMKLVREIVTLGLAARAKSKIKVRQPLALLEVQGTKEKIKADLLELVNDELNVKKVAFVSEVSAKSGWISETNGRIAIALDTKITDELKEEGVVRDIARHIQTMRKDLGLTKEDLIEVFYGKNGSAGKIFANAKWQKYIKEKTITKNIDKYEEGGKYDMEKDLEIEGEKIKFAVKKVK